MQLIDNFYTTKTKWDGKKERRVIHADIATKDSLIGFYVLISKPFHRPSTVFYFLWSREDLIIIDSFNDAELTGKVKPFLDKHQDLFDEKSKKKLTDYFKKE